MLKYIPLFGLILAVALSEGSLNGIKPTNILGGPEQHASFSFIRPGLTQTSFSFNGPSSHQTFASSIGNPQLSQRVLPNVAHALSYRNPGLGYFPSGYIPTPVVIHQFPQDPANVMYLQGQQFPTQVNTQFDPNSYQAHILKLALRQAYSQAHLQTHQVPEQIQLQQEQPSQTLLGVAYSSAPSVAQVKVSGNGYKFNF